MTRVSVVVPCFNDGLHLREAVDSVLASHHPDTEIVVVDDGSTDPLTLRELASMAALGVKVVRGEHAGVSAARNTAVAAATGEYVLPLDADDRITPDFLGDAAAVLDAEPVVGLVGAGTEFFGSRSGVVHPDPPRPASWLVANQLPVTSMFRRSDWERTPGFATDLAWGEDWHFWVTLVALGREVRVLPIVGLHYRRRAGQVTSRVDWAVQESTRARVLATGLPILERYPEEGARILAAQLNQLHAIRARRGERLRARLAVSLARRQT